MEEINNLIKQKNKQLILIDKELEGLQEQNKKETLFKKNEMLNTKFESTKIANNILNNKIINNNISIINKEKKEYEIPVTKKRRKDSYSSNKRYNDFEVYLIKKIIKKIDKKNNINLKDKEKKKVGKNESK